MRNTLQKLKFLSFLLPFIILCSFSAVAQNIISGTVLGINTNEPVIGASVKIIGTNVGTVTDEFGRFRIESTTPFPWNLEVSSIGYQSASKIITADNYDLMFDLRSEPEIFDAVVVSASRKAEKVQEAPASISVVSSRVMQAASSAIDPMRELINVPGVQIQQQSAARMNIEMRGGSSLFSTSIFPILDYRSLIGPGVGTFQSDASGINSLDLQKIEVVRGPASALYGPGVTAGVLHFITKNPIDYPGLDIEGIAGTYKTFGGSLRYAVVSKNKKVGFKINTHYKRGDEFTLNPDNPTDAEQIGKFKTQIVNPAINTFNTVDKNQSQAQVLLNQQQLDPDGDGNMMQNFWWNTTVNGTLEFRPTSVLRMFASGGYNQVSSVFYNNQGEGLLQAKEYWTQFRMQRNGLFAQFFYLNNDGGSPSKPTFLYQTGNRTLIARKQIEGQLQYNFGFANFLNSDFTVGMDYRKTVNDTQHMVYGRNEDDDDFTIFGGYAQGKFELGKKVDLLLAGRVDKFNFFKQTAFSPRAGLVYKINKEHTLRATFNRAITTPSGLELNVDFPVANPAPGYFDVWLRGNKTAQTFASTPMIDFTAPGIPDMPFGTPGLPLAVPYAAVTPTILSSLAGALPANLLPIVQAILTDPTNVPSGVSGTFTGYNIFTGKPMSAVADAPTAKLEIQNTFEIGYKGTIADKFSIMVDWYKLDVTNSRNFTAISPTISYTGYDKIGADLGAAVGANMTTKLTAALIAAGVPEATAQATAAQVGAAVGGAYNQGGTQFASQIAQLSPIFGAVETNSAVDDDMVHMAAGYRTFGKIGYWGMDFGLGYLINNDLSIFGNYSLLSKNVFEGAEIGDADGSQGLLVALSVPKNKFRMGLVYAPVNGFRGNLSYQHDEPFYANFGQYSGRTQVKNLLDGGIGYKWEKGFGLDLTCTNILNYQYRAFNRMPIIHRRAILKLTYSLH